jgi:uncharacterized protein
MLPILPESIDLNRAARQCQSLHGRLPLARMHRLAGSLCGDAGDAEISWDFSLDEEHRIRIDGFIRAEMQLMCQRCLQAMAWKVDAPVRIALLKPGQSDANLPEDVDAQDLPVENPVALLDMVEDELILALPIVAKHPACPSNPCVEDAPPVVEEKRPNPFAALAVFKNK